MGNVKGFRDVMNFCRNYMRGQPSLPIRQSQMSVLEILCNEPGPHTPVFIADKLGVSRPMVAAHLAALQDLGYVTRVASPDDGRSVYVLPTKSGKKIYDEYVSANRKIMLDLSHKMGAKKFETFMDLISMANNALSEA